MKKAEKKAAREAEKQQTTEKTEKKTTAPKQRSPKAESRLTQAESMCRKQHPAHLFTAQENRGQGRTPHPHRHRKTF